MSEQIQFKHESKSHKIKKVDRNSVYAKIKLLERDHFTREAKT